MFAPCTLEGRDKTSLETGPLHYPTKLVPTTGEAYDKIARLLGLDMQPNGGASLEAFARRGDPTRFAFQTPMKKQVTGSMLP